MTDGQFDLLSELLRMTSQPILTASRLVLVNGERQVDAAREAGCKSNHLARAVVQLREAHEKLQKAYG
ncbi:MAG: hypothetical protein WBA83_16705 [Burkholderiaceae bacterium]